MASYGDLFRVPGLGRLTLAKALGRVAGASFPLALIFLVRAETGSTALAGLAVGAAGIGGAAGTVFGGRLVDRFGQARVLAPMTVLFSAWLVVLALLPLVDPPAYAYLVCAMLAAACEPPLGSALRVVLDAVHAGERARRAHAFESVANEALWVVGPLALTLLVALFSPSAALLASAACVLGGGLAYAISPLARATRRAGQAGARVRLRAEPRLVRVFVVIALWCAGYDLVVVSLPELCARFGHAELAGLQVALLSLGTIVGGLAYGAKLISTSHRRHDLALSLAGYGLCLGGLAFAPGIGPAAVLAFVAGVAGSAVLTLTYLWAGGLAPEGAEASTYTAVFGALALGGAAGGALGGLLVAAMGLTAPFVYATVLCVLGAFVALHAPPGEGSRRAEPSPVA
jgi:predicted MFS family arabinose efflux permease